MSWYVDQEEIEREAEERAVWNARPLWYRAIVGPVRLLSALAIVVVVLFSAVALAYVVLNSFVTDECADYSGVDRLACDDWLSH